MADYTDTKVSQLVINNLTQEKFEELKVAGQLQDDQIYLTPDSGNGFDLFDSKWADHILNDPSWLRADNFSWHSGDVYKSAYEHLVNEYNADTTLGGQTETINGTTVYFRLAADGHKIVPANEEAGVQAVFNSTGIAWYYILDQTNKQFKLPRERSKKLIRAYNDGYTWYRLYADGWVEQGGKWTGNLTISEGQEVTPTVTLPVPVRFGNVNATTRGIYCLPMGYDFTENDKLRIRFGAYTVSRTLTEFDWSVSGMAATTPEQNDRLYFYVGNWIKDKEIIDVGAITEELTNKADVSALNDKADIRLSNVGEVANALKFLDGLLAKRTTDDSFLQFYGGTSYNKGAYIRADGESGPLGGGFRIAACDSTNGTKGLDGRPDGTLQWGGKEIIRQQGASKGAKGYLKLQNGIIIQWGYQSVTAGQTASATITFPTAFSNTNYSCVATVQPSNASSLTIGVGVTGKTATTVSLASQGGWGGHNTSGYYWLAMGY